jgi:NitT/TauT family transport system permease protein
MNKVLDFVKKYWITAAIFVGLVIFYIIMTQSGKADPFLFPKYKAILNSFATNKGLLFVNLWSSIKLMVPSILISLAIALALGIVMGLNKRVRDIIHPVIYAFSVIPSILLSPFALLLAPNFTIASIFLIVYGTLWATLFATITGIMTIDKRYLDKAACLELKGIKKFFKVVIPAASPAILAGFVNSLRSTFVMLVYAEMYGANYGMGFFVKKYADFGMYDNVWSGFIFLVIVLVIVMQLFERLKKYILRWTIN